MQLLGSQCNRYSLFLNSLFLLKVPYWGLSKVGNFPLFSSNANIYVVFLHSVVSVCFSGCNTVQQSKSGATQRFTRPTWMQRVSTVSDLGGNWALTHTVTCSQRLGHGRGGPFTLFGLRATSTVLVTDLCVHVQAAEYLETNNFPCIVILTTKW